MILFRYLIMFVCSIIVYTIGIRLTDNRKVLNQAFGMLMSGISVVFALISMTGIIFYVVVKYL